MTSQAYYVFRMKDFLQTFNNRETAISIWLGLGLVWAISHRGMRGSLGGVVRALVCWQILIPFLLMTAYVGVAIIGLERLGFWDLAMLKSTLIWFFGNGFLLFMGFGKAGEEPTFFKDKVLECFKFAVILKLVIQNYVFTLPVEMILVASLAGLGMMQAVAESKAEFKAVAKLVWGVIGLLTITMVWHGLAGAAQHLDKFAKMSTYKELLLEPVLTVYLVPFIYCLALLSAYQTKFILIQVWIRDDPARLKRVKRQLLFSCNLSLRCIHGLKIAELRKLHDCETIDEERTAVSTLAKFGKVIVPSMSTRKVRLAEDQRRLKRFSLEREQEMYVRLCEVQDQAEYDARKADPDAIDFKAQLELERGLAGKYEADFRRKFGLSIDEQDDLATDGCQFEWEAPPIR